MADLNDIHHMLGKLDGKLDGLVQDVAEVKEDIQSNIRPPIESYKRDRNILIGGAVTVSALFGAVFGGVGKAVARALGGS